MRRVQVQKQRCAKTLVNTNPCARTLEVKGTKASTGTTPSMRTAAYANLRNGTKQLTLRGN